MISGDIVFIAGEMKVLIKSREISLTKTELKMLTFFLQNFETLVLSEYELDAFLLCINLKRSIEGLATLSGHSFYFHRFALH